MGNKVLLSFSKEPDIRSLPVYLYLYIVRIKAIDQILELKTNRIQVSKEKDAHRPPPVIVNQQR